MLASICLILAVVSWLFGAIKLSYTTDGSSILPTGSVSV